MYRALLSDKYENEPKTTCVFRLDIEMCVVYSTHTRTHTLAHTHTERPFFVFCQFHFVKRCTADLLVRATIWIDWRLLFWHLFGRFFFISAIIFRFTTLLHSKNRHPFAPCRIDLRALRDVLVIVANDISREFAYQRNENGNDGTKQSD